MCALVSVDEDARVLSPSFGKILTILGGGGVMYPLLEISYNRAKRLYKTQPLQAEKGINIHYSKMQTFYEFVLNELRGILAA